MPALISSYTTGPAQPAKSPYAAISRYEAYRGKKNNSITIVRSSGFIHNQRIFSQLSSMKMLQNDWDGYDALAPFPTALQYAQSVLTILTQNGTEVFNAAPGPNGEISIELRHQHRALELLFYSDRSVYVTLAPDEPPKQGSFSNNILPELLRWLKMK